MIFTPVLRRNAFAPQAADLALQRFLQGTLGNAAPSLSSVQVQRDEKATTLQLDVPGLSREQLQLSIEGAVVRLSSVEGAPARCSVPGSWTMKSTRPPAAPSWKTACSRCPWPAWNPRARPPC